jgi:hypothetical protein
MHAYVHSVPGACRYYVRTYVCEVKTDLSWHFGNIHGANIIITSFGNFNRFGGKWANKNISFLLSIHNGLKDQNCKKTRPKMSPKKLTKSFTNIYYTFAVIVVKQFCLVGWILLQNL